jgi:hypothetical protein
VSATVPSHSSFRVSQARKDKKEKKEYLKQMSELDKIVQQQRLENKKIEKLFSDSKRQAIQLYVALSHKQESPLLTRATNLSHQSSLDLTTRSHEEKGLTVLK